MSKALTKALSSQATLCDIVLFNVAYPTDIGRKVKYSREHLKKCSFERTTMAAKPTKVDLTQNNLLRALPPADRSLLAPHIETVRLAYGETLFEPGDDVGFTYFPAAGTMISFILLMRDGHRIEGATIGQEGAAGGIISSGFKPAFTRAVVQGEGIAFRLSLDHLESAKQQSERLRDILSRYADALLAQVLQTVGCNVRHTTEQRFCRWLLMVQDRMGSDIPLTQELSAELLGVQRTTLTETAQRLQKNGTIRYKRGHIIILDRQKLRDGACECYDTVAHHAKRVLPAPTPQQKK